MFIMTNITNHDCSTLQQIIEYNDPKLNNEQEKVMNTIMKDIKQTARITYYLDVLGVYVLHFLLTNRIAYINVDYY